MQSQFTLLHRATALLYAVFVAVSFTHNLAFADDRTSPVGLNETTRAALKLGSYQQVRLLVYQPSEGPSESVLFFSAGPYTFGYCPATGARYCAVNLNASPRQLASAWSRQAVIAAEQIKISRDPNENDEHQCPNGCLIDSLLHYYRLPNARPDADWEGVFILLYGPQTLGGDHAVLIYSRAGSAWVYDPCGRTTTCLGRLDLEHPRRLAERLEPEATSGGWLVSRDLAWLRRHGVPVR